jgi:tyrosyl-tRNA synthetase
MYGKAMSIPDEAVGEYRRLLLDGEGEAGESGAGGAGEEEAKAGEPPAGAGAITGAAARDAKRALARDLVRWLHGDEDALAAERQFERVFVAHEAPEEIEQASFVAKDGSVYLPGVMAAEFGLSGSEARRLIDQGGVTLGETSVAAGEYDVPVARADEQVLKVGKRRFRRLRAG